MSGIPIINDKQVKPPDRTLIMAETKDHGNNVLSWPEFREIDGNDNIVYPSQPTTGAMVLEDLHPGINE